METKSLIALRISLASPETIRSWSYGEVLKPETINYRRLRPEKDGLFCEAIFGPTKDYQCYCGKYKNPRYKGIVCDKCGVEVTRSSVRRERMGHIELASPVAHIWYTRRVPSYLGLLLDISRRNLDRVLYFAQYIVTYVDEEARQKVLKRMEDEITVSERQKAAELNKRILEVKQARDRRIAELNQQRAEMEARRDEQIASRLEPVIQEGQSLERMLQEKVGTVVRVPVVFTSANVEIAAAGETITPQHIGRVQRVVKEHLEELENEFREQFQRELEQIKMQIEEIRAQAEMEMEALRSELEDQSVAAQSSSARQRDELQELRPFTFLTESRYRELKSRWGQVFRADMGAEAFYDILRRLDLDKLAEDLWHEVRTSKSKQKRKKATTRLKVVEAFRRSGNRPEWMILQVLPVIPPDLRPMVQLDGGRFATSDLNDLYRRVINRNNRLKRLLELGAPDVIVRNEKRMLQEAVDSLIDNSQRGKALSRRGRRELKSLSDMLKGKKGRFRRNLLGKRVDYSGRSVIVVGPTLKLYQCGLPKTMALELFRPFVIARLVQHNYAANVKGARRLIERNRPEVWEVLEEVIKERPVLLNRAPTLHRLGIQAFEPVLIEGSAIQLHPLVTTAFNADFDGDQMAVHVPLSEKAVWEARNLMLSSKNLLKPADGEPIISPSKDMVLGVYYLTMEDNKSHRGDGRVFADLDEVELAYHLEQVEVHTNIRLRVKTWYDDQGNRLSAPRQALIETTVGRALFNRILPEEVQFVNEALDKGGVKDLIAQVYELCGEEVTTVVADRIKDIGFEYAMRSGATLAVEDITMPPEKQEILAKAHQRVDEVQRAFRRGLLTEQERNEREIEIWQQTTKEVAEAVRRVMDPNGNLAIMANSGATKGGFGPISQLAGMRGLMADPAGRIIRLPIQSNFREGLTALEYFISTHGARKGLADTALRTADAGYLTRRLVDVAQDIIVNEVDCGTQEGIWIRKSDDVAGQSMASRLYGRLTAARVVHPLTGEVLAERNQMLDHDLIRKILAAGIDEVKVRSPLTCELVHGVCAHCYGMDLGRGKMVELGAAVGIVAAQSIGEPGTQLTLRTFHTGGVAAGGDITTGLPRVEELFEARRQPKGEAVMARISGTAKIIQSDRYSDQRVVRVEHSEMVSDEYDVPEGWEINVTDEGEVKIGDPIATQGEAVITAQHSGRVRLEGRRVIVSYEQKEAEEYEIPSTARLLIRDGDHVEAGQPLTEGSLNPHMILRVKGREACQMYLLSEIQKVYRAQGQNINDKHFEVIIRKMMGRVQVIRPGDSPYLPMDLVDRLEIRRVNEQLIAEGKQPARYVEVLLGITKASLSTDSFLSAASFQHTIKVLAGAAIAGAVDPLYGLKENVIIGKLIPAGTGFHPDRFKVDGIFSKSVSMANITGD
ncbi:DNA-directed RNA polymerase subunit beta' [Thermanaerothrix sp. 4228-RoL]|uniref:DNA-directed RNA polymerase subunit beta' n=1 Tax=Thermanaerothrix solaris TaxID=3058434 RepID=A0ABU3NKS7_9CHLR|nr:DNA-directed RNA polymerase subunit beta' [Thermanaerothrix sp. 4228-RoL]MDT8897451.1 DNA-directed RNA polymerase subunit beta' [Thermanaerothrix sp. 4228-RoL]